jgi:hypothetical protein
VFHLSQSSFKKPLRGTFAQAESIHALPPASKSSRAIASAAADRPDRPDPEISVQVEGRFNPWWQFELLAGAEGETYQPPSRTVNGRASDANV